jgi:hypothetical protein
MPSLTNAAARPSSLPLPPELSPLPKGSLRVYGPVTASQCDHTGRPIQRYVTILVESQVGLWLLRRLVTNVSSSPGILPRLVEMKITADDARRWLADNPEAGSESLA